jgi:serine/threonine protein kinase
MFFALITAHRGGVMVNFSGKVINGYKIYELIGEGGIAQVYRARGPHIDSDVAIKFIKKDKLDNQNRATLLKRFELEARNASSLHHPNLIKVFDYGSYHGMPYLVMELITGGTLRVYMSIPLPYQEAIRFLLPVARALEEAHRNNVIHRDVKPSNILINDKREPVLSDFGIAKLIDPNITTNHLTVTGLVIGTPDYMAPEQWEGVELDGRADIYALGVIFYELLTGRRPFEAPLPTVVMVKALRDPLKSPRKHVASIPKEVERIVLKALAKNPNDRYATIQEFIAALEAVTLASPKKTAPVIKRAVVYSILPILFVSMYIVVNGGWYPPGFKPERTETITISVTPSNIPSEIVEPETSEVPPTEVNTATMTPILRISATRTQTGTPTTTATPTNTRRAATITPSPTASITLTNTSTKKPPPEVPPVDNRPPNPPSNVAIQASCRNTSDGPPNGQVEACDLIITWQDNSNNEEAFRINILVSYGTERENTDSYRTGADRNATTYTYGTIIVRCQEDAWKDGFYAVASVSSYNQTGGYSDADSASRTFNPCR